MRFVDFLRATVLLSAATATALAAVTVLAAATHSHQDLVPIAVGWWVLAAVIGLRLGRRAETSPPIARLLSSARASPALPEYHPGAILLNRLWPLLAFALGAGARRRRRSGGCSPTRRPRRRCPSTGRAP